MAIFEEKPVRGRIAFGLIILTFLLCYPVWQFGDRELFWNEGEYAAAAQEIHSFPPLITAHGVVQQRIHPLHPLLARALFSCGLSPEFSLRAISVLSLLALTVIVWLTNLKSAGKQAAAAAATIMITTLLTAEKAVEGYPQMLTTLILYSGWMLWFELALGQGKWNLAWISAGLFGGLAYSSAGETGLIYFALPLLVQSRPLNVWTKLRYPGVAICAALVAFFILSQKIPQWNAEREIVQSASFSVLSWLKELCVFPFDFFFRLLPWSLMLWAPFCSALIPLDPNPLFGKFHRTIFYTVFLLLWLNPETRGRDMLYLVPLAATLIGQNYWIVARRHGFRFLALFRFAGWVLIAVSLGAGLFLFLPEPLLTRFLPMLHSLSYRTGPRLILNAAEIALAFGFACTVLILCARRSALWKIHLAVFCSMMLLFWGVINPYRAWDRSKSSFAEKFRAVLPKEERPLVYKDASISGLYPECCYMKIRVLTADTSRNIPDPSDTVYVLSTGIPAPAGRSWTRLHDSIYKENRLFLYKGELRKEELDEDLDEF